MKLARMKPLVDSILDLIGRCIDTLKREEIIVRTEEDEDAEESNEEDPMYDPEYDLPMCARHEAFLTGYRLGVLLKAYGLRLHGKDGLCERLCIGGAVEFVGFEFLRKVPEGSMSTESVTSARRERSRPQEHQCNARIHFHLTKVPRFFSAIIIVTSPQYRQSILGQFHPRGRHSTISRALSWELTRVIEWLNLTDSTAEAHIHQVGCNKHCHNFESPLPGHIKITRSNGVRNVDWLLH